MFRNKFIRDYLTFSRRDRTGIVALLVLILVIYFLPVLFAPSSQSFPVSQDGELSRALDSLHSREAGPRHSSYLPTVHEAGPQDNYGPGEVFFFNPNTLPPEGWQRLGLPARTIRTIINYRSKGGRFRQPADLQKVWGLPPGFYERVKGHISIIPQSQPYLPSISASESSHRPERRTASVNINTADTTAFIALPGIGSKLASRIISFRDKLGGFYSTRQVSETFGLPDSTFRKIEPYLVLDNTPVKKVNINTATIEDLKNHPYIRWNLAKAIVAYRQQHGPFNSLEDLKKISLMDEATLEKVRAYLECGR